jgi:hypothetical protein
MGSPSYKTPGPSLASRDREAVDGEFTIVTSDDEVFHVPDYTLYWASCVPGPYLS